MDQTFQSLIVLSCYLQGYARLTSVVWGCVKSQFICYKSPPGARMASLQNDFFDFLGLFAQPHMVFSKKGYLNL